jgi:hypothetical protein
MRPDYIKASNRFQISNSCIKVTVSRQGKNAERMDRPNMQGFNELVSEVKK